MNEIKMIHLRDSALCKRTRQEQNDHCDQQRFLRRAAVSADDANDCGQCECRKLPQNEMQNDTASQRDSERYPAEHIQTLCGCIQIGKPDV